MVRKRTLRKQKITLIDSERLHTWNRKSVQGNPTLRDYEQNDDHDFSDTVETRYPESEIQAIQEQYLLEYKIWCMVEAMKGILKLAKPKSNVSELTNHISTWQELQKLKVATALSQRACSLFAEVWPSRCLWDIHQVCQESCFPFLHTRLEFACIPKRSQKRR